MAELSLSTQWSGCIGFEDRMHGAEACTWVETG